MAIINDKVKGRRCIVKYLTFILMLIGLSVICTSSAGAETSAIDFYTVGISDVINIKVLDNQHLNTSTMVSSDGTITFPNLGTVYVKGMKISEIEKEITKRLSDGYIKYPVVTVSLMQSTSRKFYTYGVFNRNGEFPFQDDLTVMKAISVIGGVSAEGRFGKMIVRRKSGESKVYKDLVETHLNDGFISSRKIENMPLQPDDILILERNKTILIEGEVQKRGRFTLENNMTVLRALLQAGGASEKGKFGTIKVRRKEGKTGEYIVISEAKLNDGAIESRAVEDTILKPDDILILERNDAFLIEGEAINRGRFILEKDMTVLRALLQAGGATEKGEFGTIKVRRKERKTGGYKDIIESKLNDGSIESSEVEDTILKPDDILILERSKTFLIEGEVGNRGRFVIEKDMTVLRALLQAGSVLTNGKYGTIKVRRKQGKTGEYKVIAEAKLNDGAIESSEVEDILLQPDDILLVERNKTFMIYGEVNKIGEFILEKDMTVFKALTIAGGFNKWGSESRVMVLRSNENSAGFESIKVNIDDVIDGDASADISLQEGDIIIVKSGLF